MWGITRSQANILAHNNNKQVELQCFITKATISGIDIEPFFEISYLGTGGDNNNQIGIIIIIL